MYGFLTEASQFQRAETYFCYLIGAPHVRTTTEEHRLVTKVLHLARICQNTIKALLPRILVRSLEVQEMDEVIKLSLPESCKTNYKWCMLGITSSTQSVTLLQEKLGLLGYSNILLKTFHTLVFCFTSQRKKTSMILRLLNYIICSCISNTQRSTTLSLVEPHGYLLEACR